MGVVSEYFIRKLVKAGSCPGIYSGKRFLVNVDALFDMLDSASRTDSKSYDRKVKIHEKENRRKDR